MPDGDSVGGGGRAPAADGSRDGRNRRTKIVATIGPASEAPATLEAMIDAGMDMARLGLAHGPVEQSIEKLQSIRRAAAQAGRFVGVMADLPGPKIRAGSFPGTAVSSTTMPWSRSCRAPARATPRRSPWPTTTRVCSKASSRAT